LNTAVLPVPRYYVLVVFRILHVHRVFSGIQPLYLNLYAVLSIQNTGLVHTLAKQAPTRQRQEHTRRARTNIEYEYSIKKQRCQVAFIT
jgi:hypothetical protein